MNELFTSGSVGGWLGNRWLYPEKGNLRHSGQTLIQLLTCWVRHER